MIRPARASLLSAVPLALLAVALCAGSPRPPATQAPHKKLIEMGWDIPDTRFLLTHTGEMERSPFDGVVFRVTYERADGSVGEFTKECWGSRVFQPNELQPALDDLRAAPFRRFTDNFLRMNVQPGDVDWFDDYSAILGNARLAARIAKQGGCRGILFDPEPYGAPLFSYRKQRDAGRKSWSQYAQQARRRGSQVMAAWQQEFPDLTVFLTFGYSLPHSQYGGGKRALADCQLGLLAPFLDGMLDAARGGTRLVEGYELSYAYRDTARFAAARRAMKQEAFDVVGNPAQYRKHFSLGFGIWLDLNSSTDGWDTLDASRNFYSPESFRTTVRQALQLSDEYVWIYCQKPSWWAAAGSPRRLPPAYDAALRSARP